MVYAVNKIPAHFADEVVDLSSRRDVVGCPGSGPHVLPLEVALDDASVVRALAW